ncbi:MAG: ribonuclease Z [Thermoplasmatales archaeon]|nr:ribonuclease Z [Thermoplasmatales archaeon]
MFEILFLGTAAAVPSKARSMPCIALRHRSGVAIFDCGEGAQRQFMFSPFSFMKVDWVFLTHLHGDHVLGLPGLLQTMSLSGRDRPILVVGPGGTGESVRKMLDSCMGTLAYGLEVVDAAPGDSFECEGFTVTAVETEHVVESLGYVVEGEGTRGRFDREKALSLGLEPGNDFSRISDGETVKGVVPEEVLGPAKPGMRIVISGDTVPTPAIAEACRGADLLIHEATFMGSERDVADATGHTTAGAAAEIAKAAGVRHLILTHISNRYDGAELAAEAAAVFPGALAAADMDHFRLTRKGLKSI